MVTGCSREEKNIAYHERFITSHKRPQQLCSD